MVELQSVHFYFFKNFFIVYWSLYKQNAWAHYKLSSECEETIS